ncbi:PKD domain-containing protein [Paraglaciecola hydrolytica]|uniref:Fibronectin type-III domain-containing protein n=1 Tax=Paraglaciecola hydrolytica TaxID=1799789 RepID=A0A148KLE5_9ALTE|nr:PKD domain-containing protein [Paraglaciecola hydrolytica]KXI27055.1 hypothetical protein AX660_01305 [Paraglaciecola hydrolytica]
MKRYANQIIVLLFIILLGACGGGSDSGGNSGGSNPPANKIPTVNAGNEQTVDEQTNVTLSGTAADSDGSISSYSWTQTGGTTVTLSNNTTASASFTAPDINVDETLTFKLTVTDNDGANANDSVSIIVKRVNELPTVSAGNDQTVNALTTVNIAGSAVDLDGTISSVNWMQISGTNVQMDNPSSLNFSFVAPDVNTDETLIFQVTATDDDGASSTATVSIFVMAIDTIPPNTPSIALLYAANIDAISLSWNEVSDNKTLQSGIVYQLHSSTEVGFTPSDATLLVEGANLLEYKAIGLNADTEYYFKLVAIDSANNSSSSAEYSMQTLQTAIVLNDDIDFKTADELKLGAVSFNQNTLTFNKNSDVILPALNSIIYVEDSNAAGYLKRVEQVTDLGSMYEVLTSDAMLEEVLDIGQIALKVEFPTLGDDIFANTSQNQPLLNFSKSRKLAVSPMRKSGSSAVTFLNQSQASKKASFKCEDNPDMEYEIDLLNKTITIKDNIYGNTEGVASEMVITLKKIAIDPKLDLNFDWSFIHGLDDSHVLFDLNIEYEAENKGKFSTSALSGKCKVMLFEITRPIYFLLGPVPVYLELTLAPSIELSALITTGLDVEFTASKTIKIQAGTRYNQNEDKWTSVSDNYQSFSNDSIPKIEAFAKAEAELTLDPKIELTLYKVPGLYLSLEPHIKLEVDAEFADSLAYLRGDDALQQTQLSKLDLSYFPECNLGWEKPFIHSKTADLDVKSNLCSSYTDDPKYWFALSDITLAKGNENKVDQFHVVATATNKAEKEFDKGSVIWQIFPEDLTIEALPDDPMQAIVNTENATHHEYTILFSGQEQGVEITRRTSTMVFQNSFPSVMNVEYANTVKSVQNDANISIGEGEFYREMTCKIDEFTVGFIEYYSERWEFDFVNNTLLMKSAFNENALEDVTYEFPATYNPETQSISLSVFDPKRAEGGGYYSQGTWDMEISYQPEKSTDESLVFEGQVIDTNTTSWDRDSRSVTCRRTWDVSIVGVPAN